MLRVWIFLGVILLSTIVSPYPFKLKRETLPDSSGLEDVSTPDSDEKLTSDAETSSVSEHSDLVGLPDNETKLESVVEQNGTNFSSEYSNITGPDSDEIKLEPVTSQDTTILSSNSIVQSDFVKPDEILGHSAEIPDLKSAVSQGESESLLNSEKPSDKDKLASTEAPNFIKLSSESNFSASGESGSNENELAPSTVENSIEPSKNSEKSSDFTKFGSVEDDTKSVVAKDKADLSFESNGSLDSTKFTRYGKEEGKDSIESSTELQRLPDAPTVYNEENNLGPVVELDGSEPFPRSKDSSDSDKPSNDGEELKLGITHNLIEPLTQTDEVPNSTAIDSDESKIMAENVTGSLSNVIGSSDTDKSGSDGNNLKPTGTLDSIKSSTLSERLSDLTVHREEEENVKSGIVQNVTESLPGSNYSFDPVKSVDEENIPNSVIAQDSIKPLQDSEKLFNPEKFDDDKDKLAPSETPDFTKPSSESSSSVSDGFGSNGNKLEPPTVKNLIKPLIDIDKSLESTEIDTQKKNAKPVMVEVSTEATSDLEQSTDSTNLAPSNNDQEPTILPDLTKPLQDLKKSLDSEKFDTVENKLEPTIVTNTYEDGPKPVISEIVAEVSPDLGQSANSAVTTHMRKDQEPVIAQDSTKPLSDSKKSYDPKKFGVNENKVESAVALNFVEPLSKSDDLSVFGEPDSDKDKLEATVVQSSIGPSINLNNESIEKTKEDTQVSDANPVIHKVVTEAASDLKQSIDLAEPTQIENDRVPVTTQDSIEPLPDSEKSLDLDESGSGQDKLEPTIVSNFLKPSSESENDPEPVVSKVATEVSSDLEQSANSADPTHMKDEQMPVIVQELTNSSPGSEKSLDPGKFGSDQKKLEQTIVSDYIKPSSKLEDDPESVIFQVTTQASSDLEQSTDFTDLDLGKNDQEPEIAQDSTKPLPGSETPSNPDKLNHEKDELASTIIPDFIKPSSKSEDSSAPGKLASNDYKPEIMNAPSSSASFSDANKSVESTIGGEKNDTTPVTTEDHLEPLPSGTEILSNSTAITSKLVISQGATKPLLETDRSADSAPFNNEGKNTDFGLAQELSEPLSSPEGSFNSDKLGIIEYKSQFPTVAEDSVRASPELEGSVNLTKLNSDGNESAADQDKIEPSPDLGEKSDSVISTDENNNPNPTFFTNKTEPLHDLEKLSTDPELDSTGNSSKLNLTLDASDPSLASQNISNESTLDSDEKLLKPTIFPDIGDRGSNEKELVVVVHQDVPESSTVSGLSSTPTKPDDAMDKLAVSQGEFKPLQDLEGSLNPIKPDEKATSEPVVTQGGNEPLELDGSSDLEESRNSRLNLGPAIIQHATDPSLNLRDSSDSKESDSSKNKLDPVTVSSDISLSSDLNETSNNTVLDNNQKSSESVIASTITKSTSDADVSFSAATPVNKVEPIRVPRELPPSSNFNGLTPSVMSANRPNKIERAFFQYGIDQTKELVTQSCRDNSAISPMGRLILLSLLAYSASPAEKLLYSRKLHLSQNDFNLTVGLNGGAAHAIRPFLLEETKHPPFMRYMWLKVNMKEEIRNWKDLTEALGVKMFTHTRTKVPYYTGQYGYKFEENWSHFSHRCLDSVKQAFYSGPKQRKTVKFTAMFGDYRVGKINRLKSRFIEVPYKYFKGEQMKMIFLRPYNKISDIRKLMSSKEFHNLTYQDFMNGRKRDIKLLLPPITIDECVDWRVKPEFRHKSNTRVDIYHSVNINIASPDDSHQLCNQIEIDEFGGSVFIVNRPSVMFLMWKRMILLSAIINNPR